VSPAVLSLATRAQLVLVGRRSGSSTLGQVAINRTLVRAARRGRRVVRLKGGDPFLFGRGGEEALALAEAGVAFEIVPGISSALAAPALASIPVTHRGLSGSVLITSGHDLERFGRLVRDVAPGAATLVVLMGGGNRAGIQRLLLAEGWPRATPAAILWSASLPRATSWFGPLDQIDRSNDSDDPVTIVIGEVVAVREALNQRYRETEMPASRGVRHG
jgi:siroheme synthase